ncbi:SHOCT domain-containing protein [Flavobacterium sp.]|uniref:SHOCT domain-containing protein n=1 Tax=Flavobacterium sp. TaxID=239 RepID=UPI0037BF5DD9
MSVQAHHNGNQIQDASCTLTNDKGSWFIKTPGSTTIQKSGQDLVVTCNKDGVPAGSTTVASSANGGVWGNILLGGFIGYAIDASTGAGFDYPTSMSVQMGQVIKLEPPKPNPDGSMPESNQQIQTAQAQSSSGGLVFDQTAQSPTAQKLRELKTLKDEGVITQKEYDAKKAAVLKGM